MRKILRNGHEIAQKEKAKLLNILGVPPKHPVHKLSDWKPQPSYRLLHEGTMEFIVTWEFLFNMIL
jgi:hypothetical protein